jgi:hypothetical protein
MQIKIVQNPDRMGDQLPNHKMYFIAISSLVKMYFENSFVSTEFIIPFLCLLHQRNLK